MAKRFSSNKGPSQRQLRAGELLRHTLVEIFQREDLRDPALRGVSITISEVRVSPDLKNASIFCTPLGASVSGTDTSEIMKALNKIGPHFRHLLAGKIEMKYTPALRFLDDDSFNEARRIDKLLADPSVARDLNSDKT